MSKQFLFLLLCFVGSVSLSAQSIYYNQGQDNFLRLEFNKPFYPDDTGHDFSSYDVFLNGEFTVGRKNKIAFELPFSHLSYRYIPLDFSPSDEMSASQLGNISIAYQMRDLLSPNYLEFKLRFPTAGDGDLWGVFSDNVERITAVLKNMLSVEGSYTLESSKRHGLYYRFKPGIKVLIPTNKSSYIDGDVLLDMNILGGFRSNSFDFNAGITTRTLLTEGGIDGHFFGNRVVSRLISTLSYTGVTFTPGLLLGLPLGDSYSALYDLVLGVHVGFTLGTKSKRIPVDNPLSKD